MSKSKPLHMHIQTALRGAGGGGGGSSRTPIESPDSLRSIAYARILDLVSEGEIVGFADQENPLSCVYLNETPVANADGTLNFRNIQIDSRVGTQTQDYLPNFDGVENEIAVNSELRQGTPWVRAITNVNLNSIRIRISTPAMSETDTGNGDIKGSNVNYVIELRTDGGTFVVKYNGAIKGKTTSKYERSHRIQLPPAATGWTVRVTRTTPNSESVAVQNVTVVESYTEIIEAKLRMPMSALVSLVFDAEQFNSIPSRAYRLKGRIIRVPSNYNPDTRTYTGVWDGTFQSRYSNNPAWVFYDMATNDRYGLGHLVPTELVDKWTLYRIAQYCDQLVDDGFGTLEPRFTCNLVLQVQNDALRVMQDLATVFRGIIYANGGSITAVADMPEDPVYTYTPANTLEDTTFVYSGSSKKVRHTVALVSWSDLSDFGRAKVEYVDDPEGIARYGVQQTEVIAMGCTSRGQARRWGRYLLATERYETDSVVFAVGLDGTLVAPGKIINIADPLRQGQRRGGRIRSATTNTVTVDFMSLVVEPGDTLVVTLPTGVTQRRTVSSVESNTITVSQAFSGVPVVHSVWAVDSAGVPLARYRVLAVADLQEEGGGALGYSVSAIVHIPGKYAYADSGEPIEPFPIPQVPGPVVPSPTGLAIAQRDVADANTAAKIVNLSWDIVPVAVAYNVQWRQGDGNWVDLGSVGYTNLDIPNVNPGPFEVQVSAINAVGVRSLPTFGGPYDITPVSTPPGFVGAIRGELAQEIIDRFEANAQLAIDAANDATAKADAAREAAFAADDAVLAEAMAAADAAQAAVDALAAEVGEIVNAPDWEATDSYVAGWLVKYDGRLKRAKVATTNQRPDLFPNVWEDLGPYSSVAEVAAAALSMSTATATELAAEAARVTALYARMPPGTNQLATTAMVAAEETARVNADTALAGRTQAVEARMPAGTGVLGTAANVTAAQAAADAAATAAGNKGKVIFSSTAPAAADRLPQNLWIDTTNNAFTPKRWISGTTWGVVTDKAATDAAAAAAAAMTYAQGVSATVATNETASVTRDNALGTRINTIEVRMPTGTDKLANEARIITAESAAATATAAVGTRVGSVEARMPAGSGVLGTAAGVTAAQAAADAAATAAGNKGKVIYGSTAPVAADRVPQNLWIDTTGGANTPKRWTTGTTWVAVTDKAATDAAAAAAAALAAANTVDARVTSVESASVTRDNALGTRTATIEARMPAGTDALVNEARVVTAENASITRDNALGQRVNAVEVTMRVPDFAAVMSWEFINANPSYNGFSAVGATFESFVAPSSYGAMVVAATATDPNFITPVFSLVGKQANVVRALIRRRAGTAPWDGTLYWATASHGFGPAYSAGAAEVPRDGGWHTVEWDLSGSADWNQNTITRLRFDFDTGTPSTVDVRSVSIGSTNGTSASSASVTAVETASVSRDGALGQRIDSVTATANNAQSTATQALTATGTQASILNSVQAQQALDAFTATHTWDFRGGTAGFTFANASVGVFPVVTNSGIGVDNTGFDPRYASPALSLDGRKSYIVRAMIRRRVAGTWDGGLFWATPLHGISGSFRAQAQVAPGNQWQVVEWDLTANDDWRNSTSIRQLWFDLEADGGTTTDIRWISIGNKTTAGDVAGGGVSMVTQLLEANVNAKYGLYLQAGNLISGFESTNNGIVADFNILATIFRITSPSGGARTEFSNGNWRVYDANGVLRVAMGVNI